MADGHSLPDNEKSFPPEKRLELVRDGVTRPVVNEFPPAESLFRAILDKAHIDQDKRLRIASIEWPGSDGVSVNRGRFSLAEDLTYTLNKGGIGWARCTCDWLPERVDGIKSEGKGNDERSLEMKPVHSPAKADLEHRLPENYAHSLLKTYIDNEDKRLPRGIRKKAEDRFRQLLHTKFEVLKYPS